MGYDLIEVCVEDPTRLTAEALKAHAARTGLAIGICGAFGPDRDVSAEDAGRRQAGIDYLETCIDLAAAVGSTHVAGPMYAPTGQTRMLDAADRAAQLNAQRIASAKPQNTPRDAGYGWPSNH
ncbi:sugar phosphate isomerase/epimerase family protein [Arthrobacter sp. UC242_113]|uniref:sugar phosphate isomerase/epimerase family protein n=1 Tax=Arthrobacter sp. UC242_113 TaxID=3374550 RepID=UPI0037565B17